MGGREVSVTVTATVWGVRLSSNKGRNVWWGRARKSLGWRQNPGACGWWTGGPWEAPQAEWLAGAKEPGAVDAQGHQRVSCLWEVVYSQVLGHTEAFWECWPPSCLGQVWKVLSVSVGNMVHFLSYLLPRVLGLFQYFQRTWLQPKPLSYPEMVSSLDLLAKLLSSGKS